MAHLFKAIRIVDKVSAFDDQTVDLLIKDGRIAKIAPLIGVDEAGEEATVIKEKDLHCSLGWFELGAFVGEPGHEHRETIESLMKAASFGGYTEVACLPNVEPVVQTRASIEYLTRNNKVSPVQLHATAAVTHDLQGKDLAELVDLNAAGAIAFADGSLSLQSADVVLKALNYLKLFNGLLITKAENTKIANGGQMHEGVTSTSLGLKGIPAVAEELQVTRDLQLLEYIGGRIHFSQLSTVGALEAVKEAKQKGLHVTCDVAAHQCAFIDETIEPFDTNFKVSPPFRGKLEREAILAALADGTIDTIVSGHTPWDSEAKELEFDLAESGIVGLQTAFSVAFSSIREQVSLQKLIEMLTYGARKVVGLPLPSLSEGSEANLTFFHPAKEWHFSAALNASASRNSPFIGKDLKGCVFGTFLNNRFIPNPAYQEAKEPLS